MSGDTLVVGGIGHNSDAGVAYVFTVSRSGIFQADQRIEHPEQVRPNFDPPCPPKQLFA